MQFSGINISALLELFEIYGIMISDGIIHFNVGQGLAPAGESERASPFSTGCGALNKFVTNSRCAGCIKNKGGKFPW